MFSVCCRAVVDVDRGHAAFFLANERAQNVLWQAHRVLSASQNFPRRLGACPESGHAMHPHRIPAVASATLGHRSSLPWLLGHKTTVGMKWRPHFFWIWAESRFLVFNSLYLDLSIAVVSDSLKCRICFAHWRNVPASCQGCSVSYA